MYPCKQCGKSFASLPALGGHASIAHAKEHNQGHEPVVSVKKIKVDLATGKEEQQGEPGLGAALVPGVLALASYGWNVLKWIIVLALAAFAFWFLWNQWVKPREEGATTQ